VVLEHILVFIVRGNIVCNSTGQLIVDYLPDPSVAHVLPIVLRGSTGRFVRSVIENLLVNRRNAGLLGDRHGFTTHDSENRRSASIRLVRLKAVRHEQVIAIAVKAIFISVRASPRSVRRKGSRSGLSRNTLLLARNRSRNFIKHIAGGNARTASSCRAGRSARHILRKPFGDNLSSGIVGKLLGVILLHKLFVIVRPLNGGNHLRTDGIICPFNIGSNLAIVLLVNDFCLEDLIGLERIALVVLGDLVNRDATLVALSKRHGHGRHNATEAQRCCEAGGYCQACDVLAHAHLLFLCFLLEFHLI